jgi:hypothetical protein
MCIDLNALGNLATICGFIYGFRWLRDFKTQKRLENQSTDARKALDELLHIEELLNILSHGKDNERHTALNKLGSAFKRLYYTLLLLKEYQQMSEQIKLINQLIQVLSNNKSGNPQDLLDQIENIKNKNKLFQLKEVLLKIYQLETD